MTASRVDFEKGLKKIADGARLSSFTTDTINTGGMCAQFARQTTEDILGLKAGTWPVATMALDFMRKAGRNVRWAADYEKAARFIGYNYPDGTKPQTGDIGYWPYKERRSGNDYGHTAIFYGYIGGVGYWLENTDARTRKNGRRIYEKGHVWLTPDTVLGIPRTLIRPQAAKFAEEVKDAPKQVKNEQPAKEIEGFDKKRLFVIRGENSASEEGVIEKISLIGDKLYVKTKKE